MAKRTKKDPGKSSSSKAGLSRRDFLTRISGGVIAAAALPTIPLLNPDSAEAASLNSSNREQRGRKVRKIAADLAFRKGAPVHKSNSDERDYPYFASYSKALRHNSRGEVIKGDYKKYLDILDSGEFERFNNLQIGFARLADPPAGLAYVLAGADSQQFVVPPAPRISSARAAAEMGLLYWMALCRDVNFTDFDSDPDIAAAVIDLNSSFTNLPDPNGFGPITADNIFRGFTPDEQIGPYISQFLYQNISSGSYSFEQKQRSFQAGIDYLTTPTDWLAAQSGEIHKNDPVYDSTKRYIRNGRDLARWVEEDELAVPYINAVANLLELQVALNPGNPYVGSSAKLTAIAGFVTFGLKQMQCMVASAAFHALQAAWFQKWYVHRRLRPEEFGGRVHYKISEAADYQINSELLNSDAIARVYSQHGSYLLPQAFQDGCPTHPAYPAGHATVAGACITMIKAFFDEEYPITDPVVPSSDGQSLLSYSGEGVNQLTVRSELHKLGTNIAMGRNWAGIHYYSDLYHSMRLGERVAIEMLRQQSMCYAVKHFYKFTRLDGSPIKIQGGVVA